MSGPLLDLEEWFWFWTPKNRSLSLYSLWVLKNDTCVCSVYQYALYRWNTMFVFRSILCRVRMIYFLCWTSQAQFFIVKPSRPLKVSLAMLLFANLPLRLLRCRWSLFLWLPLNNLLFTSCWWDFLSCPSCWGSAWEVIYFSQRRKALWENGVVQQEVGLTQHLWMGMHGKIWKQKR